MTPEERQKIVAEVMAYHTAKLPKRPRCFFAHNAQQLLLHTPDDSQAPIIRGGSNMSPYLRALYETPLLRPEDEKGQFLKYNYARYLISKAQKQKKFSVPDLIQCRKMLTTAKDCEQLLVTRNLRLVVAESKRWSKRNQWATIFEFISEGNVALINAVQLFDVTTGNKFSTYATWAVRNALCRFFQKNQKIWNHEWTSGTSLTNEDPIDDLPDRTNEVGISDQSELDKLLYLAIEKLPPRDAEVVKLRFGLDEDPMMLHEIGVRLGVTKERIRQLEARALDMLQAELSSLAPIYRQENLPLPKKRPLSKWQQAICNLLNENLSVEQIAEKLSRSTRQIKAQITSIRSRGLLTEVA